MIELNYPVVLPTGEDDPRFTAGLVCDVARRIMEQGYPLLTGRDLVMLQRVLFEFLYCESPCGARRW